MVARLVCLAILIGCGGKYGGAPTTPTSQGKRGIEAAALPYSILDARTGRQVDTAAFWATVGAAQVVCVGEDHPNPHHHWFQLEVMKHVSAHKPLALGMEMFQRPFQGVLDDYAAHRIDQSALLSRSGYEERWGYDFGFYAPTIDTAVAAGASLLALNAPKELTKKVVRHGLESLTPDEKRQLPELVLDDAAHRAWFDATMEDMGGAHAHGQQSTGADDSAHKPDDKAEDKVATTPPAEGDEPAMPSADRIYTAQVMWDESMADGAAQWVKRTPQGLLVLLAGNGHCHDSAIVNRIKRRGVDKVISLHPVLDTDGRVAEALAKPMNDYVIVLELPADVKARMDAQ
ncbi:MAG TPA: ChaN family lipoprotein [Kofleriaceae bacterium]|nr:ChaN family lipoprotein [Kofleriaceae bacterium]